MVRSRDHQQLAIFFVISKSNQLHNFQKRHYQFLVFAILSSYVSSIKVDFGTRGLPIVPATPTTESPPQQPYREPAPVWEDQSNDIANSRPYT